MVKPKGGRKMNAIATKVYEISQYSTKKNQKQLRKKRLKFSELSVQDQIDSINAKKD